MRVVDITDRFSIKSVILTQKRKRFLTNADKIREIYKPTFNSLKNCHTYRPITECQVALITITLLLSHDFLRAIDSSYQNTTAVVTMVIVGKGGDSDERPAESTSQAT